MRVFWIVQRQLALRQREAALREATRRGSHADTGFPPGRHLREAPAEIRPDTFSASERAIMEAERSRFTDRLGVGVVDRCSISRTAEGSRVFCGIDVVASAAIPPGTAVWLYRDQVNTFRDFERALALRGKFFETYLAHMLHRDVSGTEVRHRLSEITPWPDDPTPAQLVHDGINKLWALFADRGQFRGRHIERGCLEVSEWWDYVQRREFQVDGGKYVRVLHIQAPAHAQFRLEVVE